MTTSIFENPGTEKYIGTSFSFCISDICAGRITTDDILFIIGDCKVETDTDWERLLEYYSGIYWKKYPDKAIAIANQLLSEGRLLFTNKKFGINIAKGHWIDRKMGSIRR